MASYRSLMVHTASLLIGVVATIVKSITDSVCLNAQTVVAIESVVTGACYNIIDFPSCQARQWQYHWMELQKSSSQLKMQNHYITRCFFITNIVEYMNNYVIECTICTLNILQLSGCNIPSSCRRSTPNLVAVCYSGVTRVLSALWGSAITNTVWQWLYHM